MWMRFCDVGDDVMWHDDNVNTEVIDDLPDKFNKESNTNIKNKHFTKKVLWNARYFTLKNNLLSNYIIPDPYDRIDNQN
jgi:hypothetical protein